MKAKLDHMSTFLSVCDNGSIAAAARALGLSAPAVSKQLSALEQSLDIRLLERTTRRMVLTPAGKVFREHSVATLRLLNDAERDCLSSIKGEPSGTLKVVAARWLTETFLLPHLDEFTRRYPAIDLELELAERFPDLEQENVDLIFAMSMVGSNGMVRRSLGKTAYWLCVSPDYIERHGVPETPEQLAQHRLIVHTMRRPPDRVVLRGGHEVTIRPALRLNDTRAMIDAARQGLGLAWLHHYMVREEIQAGHLCRLHAEWEQPPFDVALFYRASGRALPALRHFIDFAVSHCRLPPLPA